MDKSHATILVFWWEQRRLYREVTIDYIINDLEHPNNHPIYVSKDNIHSLILQMDDVVEVDVENLDAPMKMDNENLNSKVWQMYFDGASYKEGVGASRVLIYPTKEFIPLYFKLEFDATSNVAKYEIMILGVRVAKDRKIEKNYVFCDFEVIIKKIKDEYQTQHPRLK